MRKILRALWKILRAVLWRAPTWPFRKMWALPGALWIRQPETRREALQLAWSRFLKLTKTIITVVLAIVAFIGGIFLIKKYLISLVVIIPAVTFFFCYINAKDDIRRGLD